MLSPTLSNLPAPRPNRPCDPLPKENTFPVCKRTIVKLSPHATFTALLSVPNSTMRAIGTPYICFSISDSSSRSLLMSKLLCFIPSWPSVFAPHVNSSPLLVTIAECENPSDRKVGSTLSASSWRSYLANYCFTCSRMVVHGSKRFSVSSYMSLWSWIKLEKCIRGVTGKKDN